MTVEVAMEDIKFDTTTLTVTAGETIDFRFTNTGKIAHDAFIGDAAAQMEHEVQMSDASAHPMEEAAIVLQPGESGELQRDTVFGLVVRRARLGELAGHAADFHHRLRTGEGEHDRHLQEHAEEVADVVRAMLGEALGTIAAPPNTAPSATPTRH